MNQRKILVLGLFTALLLISSVNASIDTSKIGVKVGDKFTFKVESYNIPLTNTVAPSFSNLTITKGEVITMEVKEIIKSNDTVKYTMTAGGKTVTDSSNMSSPTSMILYTDWGYWGNSSNFGGFLNPYKMNDVSTTEFNMSFNFQFVLGSLGMVASTFVLYEKSTGVALKFGGHVESWNGARSDANISSFLITRNSSNAATGSSPVPGFELLLTALGIFVLGVTLRKIKNKV